MRGFDQQWEVKWEGQFWACENIPTHPNHPSMPQTNESTF